MAEYSELMDELIQAIKTDDVTTLSKMIFHPFNPMIHMSIMSKEVYDELDWQLKANPTVLGAACFWGSVKSVNLLLAMGAVIEEADDNGRLPIHFAAMSGNQAIFMQLLARGAKVDVKDIAGVC